MADFRIGHGYDVHRLTEGRKLIIGGVEIPHRLGLLGHSDADVATHAIMDALLGAAGMEDIGTYFPDSDPAFKGADSLELLRKVGEEVKKAGFEIVNIDSIVMCEHPKVNPHKDAMKANIARVLDLDVKQIGIKGTTTEKLGFTGRGEGIASQAIAMVRSI